MTSAREGSKDNIYLHPNTTILSLADIDIMQTISNKHNIFC
jgi:hypothetical protein